MQFCTRWFMYPYFLVPPLNCLLPVGCPGLFLQGVLQYMPACYPGLLMRAELRYLHNTCDSPVRSVTALALPGLTSRVQRNTCLGHNEVRLTRQTDLQQSKASQQQHENLQQQLCCACMAASAQQAP